MKIAFWIVSARPGRPADCHGFAPLLAGNCHFSETARGCGSYCIAVTDGAHSPLKALSHEQIFIPADHPVLHGSVIAALAAFETILAILAAHHQCVSDAVSNTRFLMPYFYAYDDHHPHSSTRTADVSDVE